MWKQCNTFQATSHYPRLQTRDDVSLANIQHTRILKWQFALKMPDTQTCFPLLCRFSSRVPGSLVSKCRLCYSPNTCVMPIEWFLVRTVRCFNQFFLISIWMSVFALLIIYCFSPKIYNYQFYFRIHFIKIIFLSFVFVVGKLLLLHSETNGRLKFSRIAFEILIIVVSYLLKINVLSSLEPNAFKEFKVV